MIVKLKSFNREKSIRRAESREKMLDKIQRLDKPVEIQTHMRLSLEPRTVSGNDVLTVEELSKSFPGQTLFTNISFQIKRGERIALIGNNGTGKTTMLKILNSILPADSGSFSLGSKVQIGYYDQEHHVLHSEKTIFQEISDSYPTLTETEIRNMLAAFLFTGDDVLKKFLLFQVEKEEESLLHGARLKAPVPGKYQEPFEYVCCFLLLHSGKHPLLQRDRKHKPYGFPTSRLFLSDRKENYLHPEEVLPYPLPCGCFFRLPEGEGNKALPCLFSAFLPQYYITFAYKSVYSVYLSVHRSCLSFQYKTFFRACIQIIFCFFKCILQNKQRSAFQRLTAIHF